MSGRPAWFRACEYQERNEFGQTGLVGSSLPGKVKRPSRVGSVHRGIVAGAAAVVMVFDRL